MEYYQLFAYACIFLIFIHLNFCILYIAFLYIFRTKIWFVNQETMDNSRPEPK